MIGLPRATEPTPPGFDFDALVRQPGRDWLARHPGAPAGDMPALWRSAQPSLRQAFKGVCAYFGTYVMPATGASSVDHHLAKSRAPELAYEWANYRFVCARMNTRKHIAEDVVDPVGLGTRCFDLWFPTMQIRPSSGLDVGLETLVQSTIVRLGLNAHECLQERGEHWENYVRWELRVERLVAHAPFLASEALRQQLLKVADEPAAVAALGQFHDR